MFSLVRGKNERNQRTQILSNQDLWIADEQKPQAMTWVLLAVYAIIFQFSLFPQILPGCMLNVNKMQRDIYPSYIDYEYQEHLHKNYEKSSILGKNPSSSL